MESNSKGPNFIFSFSGLYICHVKNEAGDSNYTYQIIVYDPPAFENTTLNETTVTVISETDFSIDFHVNGYPAPEVRLI